MTDRAMLIARLRFLEQSYKRLQELKTQAEQRYQSEMNRLLAELKTASTLRGDQVTVDEDGSLPEEVSKLLEQMVDHPDKGLRARALRSEQNDLQGRIVAVVQEIEQILKFL